MISDGRQISSDLDADICIIGAGPAGITFALELLDIGLTIVLLEGGGESHDSDTQSLYSVENIGTQYAPIEETRSRFFGGSSNCWGGWCRPLDPIDFEERDWIPDSGWPFRREELLPYYERANSYLGLHSMDYSETFWEAELKRKKLPEFPQSSALVTNHIVQFSPPVRFGKAYGHKISASADINLVLMANVTEIDNSMREGGAINVHAATLGGHRFKVRARSVVLAAGGIENARLLLVSRRQVSHGLGNEHDLVGRYYTDHPRVRSATISSSKLISHLRNYDSRLANPGHRSGRNPNKIGAQITPTPRTQRDKRLPNSRTYLFAHYAFEQSRLYHAVVALRANRVKNRVYGDRLSKSMKSLMRDVMVGMVTSPQGMIGVLDQRFNLPIPGRRFTLETVIEPIPNYHSRVTLTGDKDRLGMNRVCLNWQLTDQDRDNIKATTSLVTSEIIKYDIGQMRPRPADQRDDFINGCCHHMGTTRMHVDPTRGVVDQNARLHHHRGIYCIGSSVFPTVGNDCPTITLVALAIRLADWFKRDLRGVLLQA